MKQDMDEKKLIRSGLFVLSKQHDSPLFHFALFFLSFSLHFCIYSQCVSAVDYILMHYMTLGVLESCNLVTGVMYHLHMKKKNRENI